MMNETCFCLFFSKEAVARVINELSPVTVLFATHFYSMSSVSQCPNLLL